MRRTGVRWFLIAAAIALNSLPLLRQPHCGAQFSQPAELLSHPSQTEPKPFFAEELINPSSPRPMSHVASICELPDGRLAAAWYAGSREGAPDVAICFATQQHGGQGWSTPRAIMRPEQASRELHRGIRKVGNAVLFSDPATAKLWLLYVTITVGGWSGSSLNLSTSADEGETWMPSQRLTLSPLFNISELVRNRPIRLDDGGWVVPIYHECVGKFPELLWLGDTADGGSATKSRITGGRSGFQPALAVLNTNTALAFLRDCSPRRRITVAASEDGADTWTSPAELDLPNPDSGLSALRLAHGRLLLAFNDSPNNRENLRLAVSENQGRSWKRVATLEQEPGAEFSYPYLLQARDGKIHLVYTWKRKAIKHVAFNMSGLNAQQARPLR